MRYVLSPALEIDSQHYSTTVLSRVMDSKTVINEILTDLSSYKKATIRCSGRKNELLLKEPNYFLLF